MRGEEVERFKRWRRAGRIVKGGLDGVKKIAKHFAKTRLKCKRGTERQERGIYTSGVEAGKP